MIFLSILRLCLLFNFINVSRPYNFTSSELPKYCQSTVVYNRLPTRPVKIGNVTIGGENPIAIQTMTSSDTANVADTVDQILRCVDAGADIVRLTVQSVREAKASHEIKDRLLARSCHVPLVADIHFNPKIALLAADVFDKVRINPGNFTDGRKTWDNKVYNTEEEFLEGGKRIRESLVPLIEKCKTLGRALRIGTNHGSLSSRILSYYGDTPKGMVESALEVAKFCIEMDFHDLVFSMKSSNPTVMVHSYRLLASEMYRLGFNYPIHLGVTEAGLGVDGRIKSTLGIGLLLLDGIGDTIRMSLTEDPWHEIPPCKELLSYVSKFRTKNVEDFVELHRDFKNIARRPIKYPENKLGHPILNTDGTVAVKVPINEFADPLNLYSSLGLALSDGVFKKTLKSADLVYIPALNLHSSSYGRVFKELVEAGITLVAKYEDLAKYKILDFIPLFDLSDRYLLDNLSEMAEYDQFALVVKGVDHIDRFRVIPKINPAFIIIDLPIEYDILSTYRRILNIVQELQLQHPIIFAPPDGVSGVIPLTLLCSGPLLDKTAEGILIGGEEVDEARKLGLDILQGARMRSFKTDFVSCPSCGRTLFDIQETTNKIKERMGHLPGVTIAVMGCIVNGIGEMGDADFGYVGGSRGKVDLYKGKTLIERGIPTEESFDKLEELIRASGRWVDPPSDGDKNSRNDN